MTTPAQYIGSRMTLIVTPTRSCNRNCEYCYVQGRNYSQETAGKKVLSLSLLKEFFSQAQDIFPRFRVLWHGGEPSLAGADYFAQAVELEPHGTFNLVQTNGFVSWSVLRMWKKLGFQIGTSLDLPLAVNTQIRRESLVGGLFRAIKFRTLYPRVGFLCVVTKLNVMSASDMLWFVRRFRTKFSVAFDTPVHMPSAADYATFLCWWAKQLLHERRLWELEPVRELIINVVNGRSRYCSFREDCQRNFLAIDPAGDCYPCNRWLGRRDLCYGNIRDGLDRILASPNRIRFAERAAILRKGPCHNCRWFEVCYGGCPFEGSLTNVDAYCQSYRTTRDFIDDYLQKLGAEVNTDEKIEDTPEIT